jgi:hypothetical protein
MREERYLFQIIMATLFFVILTSMWNPVSQILNSSNKSITGISNDDCIGYKNEIGQKQTEIERLNKDLSDCNSRNPIGFSIIELIVGIIVGAGIVLFWFTGHEKQLHEEIERLKNMRQTRKK